MKYQMALSLLAFVASSGCGGDVTAPMSSDINSGDLQAVASSSASSVRSGTFHAVKECSGFNGEPGSFCEFKSSNIKAIELDSRIYYLRPMDVFTPAGTDVILDIPGPGNNTAFGHCALNAAVGIGLCTFSGGTGKFTHFSGSFVVSNPRGLSWDLDGPYSFGNNRD